MYCNTYLQKQPWDMQIVVTVDIKHECTEIDKNTVVTND